MTAAACFGVVKDYPTGFLRRGRKRALDGVGFEVPRGGITALLGPNGAGKSTLLHLLVGFLRPTQGRIELFGSDPSDPRTRTELGFLPEIFAFDRFLTGRRLLETFDALSGRAPEGRTARVDAALHAVAMESEAHRKVGGYSKGMAQRIGLAQALLGDPELVILDEPMSGMDPASRRAVRSLLEARIAAGKTTLISSHILAEIETVASHVVLLQRGRVRAAGPIEQFRRRDGGARITFRAEDGRAAIALAALGLDVPQPDGDGRFALRCPGERVDEALSTLLSASASIDEVTRGGTSLEASFLELTRDA